MVKQYRVYSNTILLYTFLLCCAMNYLFDLDLDLCLQDVGSYVVLWRKNDLEVLTAGNMIVKPDHRLRYVEN